MPHIKVASFDTDMIYKYMKQNDSIIQFCAKSISSNDKIIGIEYDNKEFLLQIKSQGEKTLIKYDKVTRPMDVNILKKAIKKIADELNLDIIASNITIKPTKKVLGFEFEKKIEDFEDITEFPKSKVSIEIGFGSGKHILYQAKQNPDTLFIGLEIHTPSTQQLLKQIVLQELDNIWVVNYDARLFLEMMPSNLCEKVFVHFPVPWDKKPHRRVISSTFLDESMRVLKKGGRLELRTDSTKYFWYSLETFFGVARTNIEVRKNESLEVTSKYEARWLRMQKDIYDVYVTSLSDSKPKEEVGEFSFRDIIYHRCLEDILLQDSIVKDNYFVHFEKIFTINKNALLIKCAFGSFDRPEHKYIIVDSIKSRYYASIPVKSKINYQAHKQIMELLNVKCD
jgi:tRNA (guanine-N7-)-methyltransferase